MRSRHPFMAFQHALPVNRGQHPLLQEPGSARRARAVQQPRRKAGEQFSTIAELGEDDLAALDGERARPIAVIVDNRRLAFECGERVDRHHGCLLAGCRSRLRIARPRSIAQGKDVVVSLVAQRRLIDLDEAVCRRERTFGNDVMRHLRRHDVEHVEPALDPLADTVLLALEGGNTPIGVDRDEVGFELEVDPILLDIFHQRRDIGRDAEQRRTGVVKFDVDRGENTAFAPDVAGQVHRLLRRAGALDRHRRLREQRASPLQFLDKLVGVGRQIVAVVGRDPVAAQRFGKPRDLLPRQTQAGGDDQDTIGDRIPVAQGDRLTLGVDGDRRQPDPFDALGHDIGFGLAGLFGGENACPD
ncbi:hypothetical protein WR25_25575 [Diploscapter pachys]|uniref:Uncharacterized protein n=1 Tax=Diploscapter pachys TaxID=2018661 RepID=A0A2A2JW40_9BILA|nr:hypothetical protein WR25_25575 [Diploscapter pachys]